MSLQTCLLPSLKFHASFCLIILGFIDVKVFTCSFALFVRFSVIISLLSVFFSFSNSLQICQIRLRVSIIKIITEWKLGGTAVKALPACSAGDPWFGI